MTLSKMQIGKGGVTDNFISTLKTYFKKSRVVKIAVLKSAREKGREQTKQYSEDLLKEMGPNFTSKVIGHTIALKKWRKAQR